MARYVVTPVLNPLGPIFTQKIHTGLTASDGDRGEQEEEKDRQSVSWVPWYISWYCLAFFKKQLRIKTIRVVK